LAKEEGSRNILDDLPSLFSLPLQVLFIKKHESAWRNLLSGVTVGTAFDYPLKSTSRQTGAESQRERGANGATVSMSRKYNPSSDWLFSTTLSKYLDENQQASWNPDFTYSFGYDEQRLQGTREALWVDKKVVGGRLRFIVVEALGKVSLREDIPAALVEELVTSGLTVHPEAREEVSIRAT
jgi:hypothetical protein